jgi:hypothetical protein
VKNIGEIDTSYFLFVIVAPVMVFGSEGATGMTSDFVPSQFS